MKIYLIVIDADNGLRVDESETVELEPGDETTHLDLEIDGRRFQAYVVPVGETEE